MWNFAIDDDDDNDDLDDNGWKRYTWLYIRYASKWNWHGPWQCCKWAKKRGDYPTRGSRWCLLRDPLWGSSGFREYQRGPRSSTWIAGLLTEKVEMFGFGWLNRIALCRCSVSFFADLQIFFCAKTWFPWGVCTGEFDWNIYIYIHITRRALTRDNLAIPANSWVVEKWGSVVLWLAGSIANPNLLKPSQRIRNKS